MKSDNYVTVPLRLDARTMDYLNRIAALTETDVNTVINLMVALSLPQQTPAKRRTAKKK